MNESQLDEIIYAIEELWDIGMYIDTDYYRLQMADSLIAGLAFSDYELITAICCLDCYNLGHEFPMFDQPYHGFWCSKGHFDGISSIEDLNIKHLCSDFKENKNVHEY